MVSIYRVSYSVSIISVIILRFCLLNARMPSITQAVTMKKKRCKNEWLVWQVVSFIWLKIATRKILFLCQMTLTFACFIHFRCCSIEDWRLFRSRNEWEKRSSKRCTLCDKSSDWRGNSPRGRYCSIKVRSQELKFFISCSCFTKSEVLYETD